MNGNNEYMFSPVGPLFLINRLCLSNLSVKESQPSPQSASRSSYVQPPGKSPIRQNRRIADGSWADTCWIEVSKDTFKEAKGVP